MKARTTYVLDARTLLHHRAGQPLALESSVIGRSFAITSGPPETRTLAMSARREVSTPKRARSQVAIVDVIGPLSQRADYFCGWVEGYDSIAERVTSALSDPEVGALVLHIDSPGGDLAGLEECVRTIVAARDSSQKPIGIYVDELAASAAYWLAACVHDAGVFAPASAEVGSIGVYTMFADMRGALEKEGNAITIVRDPPGKDAANPFDPVVDLALDRERGRVNEAAARFYAAIGTARGKSPEAVRALNGATFGATSALEQGLIDGVMSFDDMVNAMGVKAKDAALNAMRGRLSGAGKRRERAMTIDTKKRPQAAEDAPPVEDKAPSGRATAAEVSQAATDCATACTDAATACDGGTADEAISATDAMIAACKNSIKVGESFLGASSDTPADKPADMPTPDGAPSASTDARMLKLLDSIESERRAEAKARHDAAVAEERSRLLGASRITNKDLRSYVEDPSTPIETVRRITHAFPSEAPNLAGDVSATATRGAGQGGTAGLDARELRICKDTGCDPERFAEQKARREAEKANRS